MQSTDGRAGPLATLGLDSKGELLSKLVARREFFAAVSAGRMQEARALRHNIRKKLHAKVNAKAPGFLQAGRLGTVEGQLHVQRFVRLIRNGGFVSPGDVYLTTPQLRERVLEAVDSRHGPPCTRDLCYCLPHRETWFPQWVRDRNAERRALMALLVKQGASPRRAHSAVVREVATCTWCGQTYHVADVMRGCPNCMEQFVGGESRSYRIWFCACDADGRPLGNPQPPESGDDDYRYEMLPPRTAVGFPAYGSRAA